MTRSRPSLPRVCPLSWLLLCWCLCACHRASPPAFEVLRTSPGLGSDTAPLLLNDAVTIYFSAPVAAFSVTPDSVAVLDARGDRVPGDLRIGLSWVTFTPRPPLSAALVDGSFVPGESYELRVAGHPRPDAVRAADGRRLEIGGVWTFRAAEREHRPGGLPAPLRPVATDLPLVLRSTEAPVALPIDRPIVRLHFSLPLLPSSVTASALQIQLIRSLREDLQTLLPKSVRAVSDASDGYLGSSVEIDLGSAPQRVGGDNLVLQPGDFIGISLRSDSEGLRDYQGNVLLPAPPQFWTVVPGASVGLLELPASTQVFADDDGLGPGFEVRDGVVRAQVRVEAGDGRLGVFRPLRDTVLAPGVPFDRGDGEMVESQGGTFAFRHIEVPKGVRVTIDSRGGAVHLLSMGAVRVAGELELLGGVVPLPERQLAPVPAASLLQLGATVLFAAGDVELRGRVHASDAIDATATALVIASAGQVQLGGELPFRTVLAVHPAPPRPAITGPRGQAQVRAVTFTHGVPAGVTCRVRGLSEWLQMPEGREVGVVRLVDAAPGLRIWWQAAPADAIRPEVPDLSPGRTGRLQFVADGERVIVPPRGFVRFAFEAMVHAGEQAPQLRELRLVAP